MIKNISTVDLTPEGCQFPIGKIKPQWEKFLAPHIEKGCNRTAMHSQNRVYYRPEDLWIVRGTGLYGWACLSPGVYPPPVHQD